MNRRVVITGVGAVTPLGLGADPLIERWTAGESGIADGLGRCLDFEPLDHLSKKEARRADRFTQLAVVSATSDPPGRWQSEQNRQCLSPGGQLPSDRPSWKAPLLKQRPKE